MRTRHVVLLALAALLFADPSEAGEPAPPNVVLIIADDLGWNDVGAFGNPFISTPHLDGLAAQGMRFSAAFVTASSCSPSRASLITGRYPHNTDAEQLHWPLPHHEVTFVEHLRRAGYWTAAVGKWHLGDEVRDRFDLVCEADSGGFQLPSSPQGPARLETSNPGDASGAAQWVPVLRDRPRDRPFFLWLAALDPHRDYESGITPSPQAPEAVAVPAYLPDVDEVRGDLALYYDEIERLDQCVGAVLTELDRQEVASDTLVLFLSDNGRPFPRDKTTLYDGGIRTPLIIRYPRLVAPGTVCSSLVSAIDIAPTMMELAGLGPVESLQGKSLLPLMANPRAEIRSQIYAERNWHDFEDRSRAVRDARFKYIRNDYPDLPLTPPADVVRSPSFRAMLGLRERGRLLPAHAGCFRQPRPNEELYDLAADPDEQRNLAAQAEYREIVHRMRASLDDWTRETADRMPPERTPDEFNRTTGEPLPNRVRPRPGKAAQQRH